MVEMPTNNAPHPVFYAGRFLNEVADAGLPEDYALLGDWDVLPLQLSAALERANVLVVLDMLSFPFESLTGTLRDVPLILVLPAGFDTETLEAVFGRPAFGRLDFFDRVATPEAGVWEGLREGYGWRSNQRLEIGENRPGQVALEVSAKLEAEDALPTSFGEGDYEADQYWTERGDTLAGTVPHRAICSVRHGLRFNKAMHRVQAAILRPQFAAVRGTQHPDVPFDVLEVGVGVGRWAASFDLAKTGFTGVDISESMVRTARANFPECRFDRLDNDLVFPYEDESFDLAFSVTVMHHNPTPAKRNLLSEMWRVTRPGGRLIFLEDFVTGQRAGSTVYPMPVSAFVGLLLEATAGQVVLEHMESLRYPHDDFVRGGLLCVSKLGVAKTW